MRAQNPALETALQPRIEARDEVISNLMREACELMANGLMHLLTGDVETAERFKAEAGERKHQADVLRGVYN